MSGGGISIPNGKKQIREIMRIYYFLKNHQGKKIRKRIIREKNHKRKIQELTKKIREKKRKKYSQLKKAILPLLRHLGYATSKDNYQSVMKILRFCILWQRLRAMPLGKIVKGGFTFLLNPDTGKYMRLPKKEFNIDEVSQWGEHRDDLKTKRKTKKQQKIDSEDDYRRQILNKELNKYPEELRFLISKDLFNN
jgi:hypothetical protein